MSFDAYFAAMHGVAPFPWQARATRGDLPDAVDLPTAAGKTALVDVWVWRVAHRTAPRRLVWVVDRRTIVDQTYQRACFIRDSLAAATNGARKEVADALRQAGATDTPLQVIRLRGGMPDDNPSWSPTQPTVIVSTVDQAGSRLLHRGYGLSPRAWPIHAGLLGTDCWWVLDEAHLSQPFVDTLRALRTFGVDVHVTSVSATLPATTGHALALTDEDRSDPVLAPRLRASKRAALIKSKLKRDDPAVPGLYVDALASLMDGDQTVRAPAIVVNRVALARSIWSEARQRFPEADVVLLTGRSRPRERDELVEELFPRIKAGRDPQVESTPTVVVATQCIEVGADFDFDALVTQIAPLDCLRQRFGRLDRLGLRGTTRAAIVACSDEAGKGHVDPIYGTSAASAWSWLERQARQKIVDMGTLAVAVPHDAEALGLCALRANGPLLTATHVDNWIQTMPAPSCSDDVAPWLHGPEAGPADVSVVWRGDIPDDLEGATDIVALCPPTSAEALRLPAWGVVPWLRDLAPQDVSDVEGERAPEQERRQPTRRGMRVLRWRGVGDPATRVINAREVRPGDTMVLPSSYGRCDRYGWAPASRAPVSDVGEVGGDLRGVIRVHPAVHPDWSTLAPLVDRDDPAPLLRALGVEGRVYYPYVGAGCIVHVRQRREAGPTKVPAAVTMEDHSRAVESEVRTAAELLGMPADVALGAYFHDQGKADERAQIALHGSEMAWLASGTILAKSASGQGRLLPSGVRHEANSVRVALEHTRMAEARDHDLALYLAAAHHGYGRPGWPAATIAEGWMDENAWSERHARLVERYGPWRLAAMEAVVRLLDQSVSARGGV